MFVGRAIHRTWREAKPAQKKPREHRAELTPASASESPFNCRKWSGKPISWKRPSRLEDEPSYLNCPVRRCRADGRRRHGQAVIDRISKFMDALTWSDKPSDDLPDDSKANCRQLTPSCPAPSSCRDCRTQQQNLIRPPSRSCANAQRRSHLPG